jgi:hypothetical protein
MGVEKQTASLMLYSHVLRKERARSLPGGKGGGGLMAPCELSSAAVCEDVACVYEFFSCYSVAHAVAA